MSPIGQPNGNDRCAAHGSTRGEQTLKRLVEVDKVPYPRPKLGEAEGDADEIECPHCGLGFSLVDGDHGYRPLAESEHECPHCGEELEVVSSIVYVKVKAIRSRGKEASRG